MYWFGAGSSDLEFGWFIDINLLNTFDLSFLDWVLLGLGHIALFMVRNVIESCTIIFFIIVLGVVTSNTTETIPNYTFIVLNNIIILIVPKILYNIIVTVKQFVVIKLTI